MTLVNIELLTNEIKTVGDDGKVKVSLTVVVSDVINEVNRELKRQGISCRIGKVIK